MKIVLSNYRYFISGGPERYLFAVKDLFCDNNMEVFPFSVKSKHNITNKWEEYFLSSVSSDDSVYFHEYKKDLKSIIKVLERNFYSPEGFLKARKYAKIVKPDIVYSLHFLNKMSPSILDGFKSAGLPVIVRLSDFALICPQALLLRKGKNCCLCVTGSILNCVRNKCIHDSISGSLIKALSLYFHKLVGSFSRIDAFVCPSKFTLEKYVEAGFPREKLYHIPTFIDSTDIIPRFSHDNYLLYAGRICEEKGVHVLLEAYDMLEGKKPRLLLVGDIGNLKYCSDLKEKYSSQAEFLNFLPKDNLFKLMKNAMLVVVPSICYDNMPNIVLEAFANGKAVIASKNGGFPDLIKDDETGMLFSTGDANDLTKKISWAIENQSRVSEMGRKAREYVENELNPNLHLKKLQELFKNFL